MKTKSRNEVCGASFSAYYSRMEKAVYSVRGELKFSLYNYFVYVIQRSINELQSKCLFYAFKIGNEIPFVQCCGTGTLL